MEPVSIRICVVGGSGMLGSYLIPYLRGLGHRVFCFSRKCRDGDDNVLFASRFGEQVLINDNHIYVGVPADTNTYYDEDINPGSFVDYQVTQDKKPWTLLRTPNEVVDTQKIKSAFLYNVKTNQLTTYLDYIDPVQGKIAGPAEQELTFKSNIDFARYNVTTLPDYFSETSNWEEQHVGKLWWDLSTAKFFNVYQEDITNQANNWSKLIPNYSVDIYEWVESDIVPADWDNRADTAAGFAKGISGLSKYGNDAYSQKLIYDPDDNSPEYVAKLIGIIDRTAKSYEKKIEGTDSQFLLSSMSLIKSLKKKERLPLSTSEVFWEGLLMKLQRPTKRSQFLRPQTAFFLLCTTWEILPYKKRHKENKG